MLPCVLLEAWFSVFLHENIFYLEQMFECVNSSLSLPTLYIQIHFSTIMFIEGKIVNSLAKTKTLVDLGSHPLHNY